MQLSRLERFLRLFTDVRAGEGTTALLMFANVFLILCSYYFIKPLREGWIAVSDIGGLSKWEVKAYSSFLQSLFLVGVIAAYSRITARWTRSALVARASLFCISNMVIFWFFQPGLFFQHLPLSGIVFYLWVGMFGVFVVAQFWAFAADIYSEERGERMMPMVAIGATSGAWFGSVFAGWVSGGGTLVVPGTDIAMAIPTEYLLLAATLPLGASIVLTRMVDERNPPAPEQQQLDASVPAEDRKQGALQLVLTNRYLLPVAVVTLLLSWVNTNGENLLFRVVQEFLAGEALTLGIPEGQEALEYTRDGTTAFYGNFYSLVNLVALVLQAFVASRLLKYGGFPAIFLIMPVIALVSYSAMALVPVLAIVKLMKVAENATDYSLSNTARHVLWLPVPSAMKYKGKAAMDSLVVRLGDGLAAATVLLGVQVWALSTQTFFVVNVVLVILWLFVAVDVVRQHRRISRGAQSDVADVADVAGS